jgi:predicted house-cleaning noncanonical NTP pyrophosphatase (MazG superfamily)
VIALPKYHKLVRDKIPEIIEDEGKTYSSRILDHDEYLSELKKKSKEELVEYLSATSDEEALEELAMYWKYCMRCQQRMVIAQRNWKKYV